jgi:hypothetical protein
MIDVERSTAMVNGTFFWPMFDVLVHCLPALARLTHGIRPNEQQRPPQKADEDREHTLGKGKFDKWRL